MNNYFRYHSIILRRRILFNYKKWIHAFVGSFLGMTMVFFIHKWTIIFTHLDLVLLIGSLAASTVIIFATPHSPYASPRHVIGGHLIAAFIGVSFYKLMGAMDSPWLCCSLTVALAILLMQITKTTHPPAGATALIAIIGSNKVHALGYLYVLIPVLSGSLILLGTSYFLRYIQKQLNLLSI